MTHHRQNFSLCLSLLLSACAAVTSEDADRQAQDAEQLGVAVQLLIGDEPVVGVPGGRPRPEPAGAPQPGPQELGFKLAPPMNKSDAADPTPEPWHDASGSSSRNDNGKKD